MSKTPSGFDHKMKWTVRDFFQKDMAYEPKRTRLCTMPSILFSACILP
ncbi:MAG: hypothetical protein HPY74_09710 [Firmicutes bacterium]|nr:hypothetical protein [Bacillota bacterium]